jgi:hypothetical protein
MGNRKLVDITFEEAVEVARLGEVPIDPVWFEFRRERNKEDSSIIDFSQVYHVKDGDHISIVSFSDTPNAVKFGGNGEIISYKTMYRIIKYLERRGFDLEAADRED